MNLIRTRIFPVKSVLAAFRLLATQIRSRPRPSPRCQSSSQLDEPLKATIVVAANGGNSFDSVERAVYASLLEMGRQAIELFLSLQGDGDLGAGPETSQGQKILRSQETQTTKLRSIFDQHSFDEFTYSPGNNPIDIAVSQVSKKLREFI